MYHLIKKRRGKIMLNKSKTSLIALTTLFSLSAFAEGGHKGFYVEIEDICRASADATTQAECALPPAQVWAEFCELRDDYGLNEEHHHRCAKEKLNTEEPTYIKFDHNTAYLKKLIIMGGRTAAEDQNGRPAPGPVVIKFETPFEECIVSASTDVDSTQNGNGRSLLEISYNQPSADDNEGVKLTCDHSSIFWNNK
jgi:hypothetical protein